ncbi:MAG: hypothetical protein ACI9NT_002222 [Bacteroidia bacterium]|jgi:hypothetical protein
MSPRLKLWLPITVLYTLFVVWYTDLGGPLNEKEIADFMVKMESRASNEEGRQRIEEFMRQDTGRQFFMVNIVDYADNPPDVAGAEPGESAQQLMGRYMEHMIPALVSRAGHPIVMGNAINDAMDIVGIEGVASARHWEMGALMRYRSRRAFMDIIANADQKDSHRYKVAALDKTIAFPIETQFNLGDPRVLLGLIFLALAALVDAFLLRRAPQ